MASTGIIVTILHPTSESPFNEEYYTTTHLPMVKDLWSPIGMQDIYACAVDESSGYRYKTVATWESEEAWTNALKDERTKMLLADAANFTSVPAIMLVGRILCSLGVRWDD